MKFVQTQDGKKLLSPITKKQREIINAFGLSADDIPAWLAKLPV